MFCLPSCLSKDYKSLFNHSPGENTLQQLSLSAHCSSASPSLSGQWEIPGFAALTLYRCWELQHVSEASTEVLTPLMVSLHQTEELEVIWRKGDHDMGGQQLHHSERLIWEKWIAWDPKPAEQDLKQYFISSRSLDQEAVNLGFFSPPQTFLLELPFTIRCLVVCFTFLTPQSNRAVRS